MTNTVFVYQEIVRADNLRFLVIFRDMGTILVLLNFVESQVVSRLYKCLKYTFNFCTEAQYIFLQSI